MDTKFLGIVSVMNLVFIHLKDFDGRDSGVLKPVVILHIGT